MSATPKQPKQQPIMPAKLAAPAMVRTAAQVRRRSGKVREYRYRPRSNDSAEVAFSHVIDLGSLDTEGKSKTAQYLHPMLFSQSPVSRIALAYGNFSIRDLHVSWAGTAGSTYSGAVRLAVVTGQGNINFDIDSMNAGRAFKSVQVSQSLEWGVDLRDVFVQPRFSMSDPSSLSQVPILIVSMEVAGATGPASAFGLLRVTGTIRFSMLGIQKTQVTQDKLTLREVVSLAGTNTIVPNAGYVVQSSEAAQAHYAVALRATPNGGFFSRLLDLGKKVLFSLDSTGFIKGVVDGVSYLFNQSALTSISTVMSSVNEDEDVVLDVVMTQPHDEERPMPTQPVLNLQSARVLAANTDWATNEVAIVGIDQFGSLVVMCGLTYYPKTGWIRLGFIDDFFFSAPEQIEIYNLKENSSRFLRIQDAETYKPVLLQYMSVDQISQLFTQEIKFTEAGISGVPEDFPDDYTRPLIPVSRIVAKYWPNPEISSEHVFTAADWHPATDSLTVTNYQSYMMYDKQLHTFYFAKWNGSYTVDTSTLQHFDYYVEIDEAGNSYTYEFYDDHDQLIMELKNNLTSFNTSTHVFPNALHTLMYLPIDA